MKLKLLYPVICLFIGCFLAMSCAENPTEPDPEPTATSIPTATPIPAATAIPTATATPSPEIIAANVGVPLLMKFYGDSIFWRTFHEIYRVHKDGGAVYTLVSGIEHEASFAVDGQYVYYTRDDSFIGIYKVPIGGGVSTQIVDLKAIDPTVVGMGELAIDATYIFFTSDENLWRVPKTGGTPVLIEVQTNIDLTPIWVDDQYVYMGDMTIYRKEKMNDTNNGGMTALASSYLNGNVISVGTHLYFLDKYLWGEMVKRVLRLGGNTETLVTAGTNGHTSMYDHTLCSDALNIYFGEYDGVGKYHIESAE